MHPSAEEILRYLIELLEYYLEELNSSGPDRFFLGEKYAYVECLEIIQEWEKAKDAGLDYDVEERFPLEALVTHGKGSEKPKLAPEQTTDRTLGAHQTTFQT